MSGLLRWAVTARLPLIAVAAKDRINTLAVLHHILGAPPKAFKVFPGEEGKITVEEGRLYLVDAHQLKNLDPRDLYTEMELHGSVLIVLNYETVPKEAFDAGELPTPPEMVLQLLKKEDPDAAHDLLPGLSGLTIKEVAEVFRLTHARDKKVTPRGIATTRKELFVPGRGLQLIDTYLPMYWPQDELEAYAGPVNEHYFLHDDKNPRLRPRGIMLAGQTGSGKTAFFKWLADKWGVPLYLLTVDFHHKYVGDSASFFGAAIRQVDEQEPCIVLFDEVEKMFAAGKDSDATQQVLSKLLWWMQERKTRVLVGMTCNDPSGIPPELFRPGRIDQIVTMQGLTFEEAKEFAIQVIDTFHFEADQQDPYTPSGDGLLNLFNPPGQKLDRVAHGAVENMVFDVMRKVLYPG